MLHPLEIGGGLVEQNRERLRLSLPPLTTGRYADAQLYDYRGLPRSRFPAFPPVRVALRARAWPAAPAGTLGFGFWNDPFSLSGGVLAAPNAVWFFYASPPSAMELADGVPGSGFKCATLNAGRPPAVLLAPAAAVAVALAWIPGLGRPVLAAARRAVKAYETPLADIVLSDWHEYQLEWLADSAAFRVDGVERLRSPAPPRGPLGFVAWMDNQYAIASRAGKFGFGLCAVAEEQWLEIEDLQIVGL
jgi:hypothetical protein